MALEVKIADEKDLVILALEGRIDSFSMEEFKYGLAEVKRKGKKNIVLMFRDLEYIDSKGMSELFSFLEGVDEEEGDVRIAEVRPEIMEMFKILGFDTANRVFDSLSDAMKSFQKHDVEEEMGADEDFQGTTRLEGSKLPLLLIAGGVFLFLVLLIVYMTRNSSPDVPSLQKKVSLLEQKVAQLEGQTRDLSDTQAKIESLRRDMTERAQEFEKELAKLKLAMGSLSQKSAPPVTLQAKPAARQAQYHTVVRGDTLFGISRKYGLSVGELRRLNNLKTGQPIMVGQKLIVASP
jgi:anti-sigma B factor antagonist